MRWLGEMGGSKTSGGWFDPLGTTEDTYLEQARQTVLADAREVTLCWYGGLTQNTVYMRSPVQGPKNLEKLRNNLAHAQDIVSLDWETIVTISENLEAVVREVIEKPTGDIMTSDVAELNAFLQGKGVAVIGRR